MNCDFCGDWIKQGDLHLLRVTDRPAGKTAKRYWLCGRCFNFRRGVECGVELENEKESEKECKEKE